MRSNWTLALALVAALSVTHAAAAQGRGNGNAGSKRDNVTKPQDRDRDQEGREKGRGKLNPDDDRRVIDDYFRGLGSMPPGLAKRQSLPPGLARQVRERGALPPGLQSRLVEAPNGLNSRLPRLGVNQHRYFAGNDLIVVDLATNRIVSVIQDALR